MNKILGIILLLFTVLSCSFDRATGIWTEDLIIEKEKKEKISKKIEEVFKKKKFSINEFNPDLRINLSTKLITNSFINNFDNNNGRIDYNGNLERKSKFKFSRIDNFDKFEPEILFYKDDIIFFDNNGSILRFNDKSKLVWKKNHYLKNEKKLNPILFFGNKNNTLIVADNVAKYYAINIDTGDLLWSKNATSPFNSEMKVYKNNFFIIDSDNTLRCFSIKNGNELWKVKTEQSFIRSERVLLPLNFFNLSLVNLTFLLVFSLNFFVLHSKYSVEYFLNSEQSFSFEKVGFMIKSEIVKNKMNLNFIF